MKLRLRGKSPRLRLARSEVVELAKTGRLEEAIQIGTKAQTCQIVLGAVLVVAGLILLFRARGQTNGVVVRKCFLPVENNYPKPLH
jgi:hypothetical protein